MGYDGGLSVKVINKELRRIINKHKETCDDFYGFPNMFGVKYKGKTQTVYYEYLDCAYVPVCPLRLTDVLDYLIELFDLYAEDVLDEDDYEDFKNELLENRKTIDANYTYVEWCYYHGDWSDVEEERFVFESNIESYSKLPEPVYENLNEEIDKTKAAEEWLAEFGEYVEKNPSISFDGTLFVFSGFVGHSGDKYHPIIEKVLKKGGQYRSKVSGITDYLIVNPPEAGASKADAAIEQQEKGKKVKIILLEDLEKFL